MIYCHLSKLSVGQAPRLCNLPSKYSKYLYSLILTLLHPPAWHCTIAINLSILGVRGWESSLCESGAGNLLSVLLMWSHMCEWLAERDRNEQGIALPALRCWPGWSPSTCPTLSLIWAPHTHAHTITTHTVIRTFAIMFGTQPIGAESRYRENLRCWCLSTIYLEGGSHVTLTGHARAGMGHRN